MIPRLPILTASLLLFARLAFAQDDAERGQPSQGQNLMLSGVQAMEGHQSIAAKLRYKAEVFNQRLIGSGRFWSEGKGAQKRICLQLQIPLGENQMSTLVHVCDSEYLWQYESFGADHRGKERRRLVQIDMARVRRAVARAGDRLPPRQLTHALSVGGIGLMLSSLEKSLDFSLVQPDPSDSKSPVWVLHGQWNHQTLSKWLPDAKAQSKKMDTSRLPKHIADQVVVKLGRRDLMPYEIDFRRRDEKGKTKSLLVVEVFDIQVDVAIPPKRFQFDPGDMKRVNGTDQYLEAMGLQPKKSAEQKKD